MSKKQVNPLDVPGATLAFVTYQRGGVRYLEFDATGTHCPVPMVNAMAGLALIAETGDRLVMVNGFEPEGLYDKLRGRFAWRVEAGEEGRVRVEFRAIPGRSREVDFSDNCCQG